MLLRLGVQDHDPPESAGPAPHAAAVQRPVGRPGHAHQPDLKPYLSKNWDLGLEWYTGREGYLAAAFFKKDITAFTSTQNITYKFGDLAQWNWTYAQLTQQQRDAIAVRSGLGGLTSLNAAQTAAVNAQDVLVSQQVNSDALAQGERHGAVLGPAADLPAGAGALASPPTTPGQAARHQQQRLSRAGACLRTYNLTAYYDAKGHLLPAWPRPHQGSQGSTRVRTALARQRSSGPTTSKWTCPPALT